MNLSNIKKDTYKFGLFYFKACFAFKLFLAKISFLSDCKYIHNVYVQ